MLAMFEALVAATERLAGEKGLRAVVLSGEGRAFCAGLDMGRFAAMKDNGGNGIPGGEKRDLTVAHPWAGEFRAAGGVGLAAAPGAGDRRDPGRRLRRRLPARARRRHALSRARCADVDHGDQMGPGAGHGGDADPREPGARRYPARTDLHRADFLGSGGHDPMASRRGSATIRAPRPSRSRARSRARARTRSAPPSAC